jgi:cephalosporin hydroxylase
MTTAVPGKPLPLTPDEFQRLHSQINDLVSALATERATPRGNAAELQQQINDLLRQIRDRAAHDRKQAQDTVNTLVRLQVAQGLAARFMEHQQPYKDHAALTAMIDDGLLHHATFIQKSPSHLRFYKALLAGMEPEPQRILEIGVKGGGSTAFWKALFPSAIVVGLDLKLRWLQADASDDGVIYLQGDQTDVSRLREVADQYGPFDLVIDDGSHVTEHQAATLRTLLPRVRSGGFYVIEDIHTSVKEANSRPVDYGDDIWADFVVAVLQRLRRGPAPAASDGTRLAQDLARRIAELLIGRQVIAIRVKDRVEEA